MFGFDVSDGVVIEDNLFNGSFYMAGGGTGNGLWTYDIHTRGVRPSSYHRGASNPGLSWRV